MAKLLITTQVYENYGAHDWDGTGECPVHWQAQGSMAYVLKNFKSNRRRGIADSATEAVMCLRSQIESTTDYWQEKIKDWQLVKDSYLTEWEQD